MASTAPIAVVGMSCRLSGGVSTPEELWTMVSRSRDGWGPIPPERFSTEAFYHPNPQKKGCFNIKSGYFMNRDLSQFDAPFFNITEQEALALDPQQRQLLECAYEAFENAGMPKESISGSNMGVFVGATASSYRQGTLRDLNQVPLFDATGNHPSVQPGRISYYFNLRGPCLAVDTACSSSLYALHAAVQSLRNGEADSAIVASASLHLQPDDLVSMSMLGIFNGNGKTYSFDHRATSGFARGEGIGCIVLKRLDDAIRSNDKVRCIINNTGTNQDGKTVGLSVPSGEAQEQLIRDVYARAGISPTETGYVEAHGTGTKVGDPVEAHAIHKVFGDGRTKRSPLYIGSVKSNVGHLESASGVISIIKACLMLEKGFILPNLNFERANDEIPFDQWNMKVPVSIRPWPRDKRFISINNFGFGGSNAHAVLERVPLRLADIQPNMPVDSAKLVVLSANDEAAANRLVTQLSVYLEQHPEIFQKRLFNDIAYTLCERRSHLPWRIAIAAESCDELSLAFNNASTVPKRSTKAPKLAFVYTGQGAIWAQMGQELLAAYPVFAASMADASSCVSSLGASFCLIKELFRDKETSRAGEALIAQPLCTAVQIALTDLLASFGVKPAFVLGHSSGEIGAAYAAGALTAQDAMCIAYHRGRVAAALANGAKARAGAMMAVGCSASDIQATICALGLDGRVTAACHNSPESTTVSGDVDAVDALAADLESRSLFHRKLRVDIAYHSHHMAPLADEYKASISHVAPKPVDGMYYSSLRGRHLKDELLGAEYWVQNLVQPVLFHTALQDLCEQETPDTVVEIGPHSALEGPIKQILKSIGQQAKYVPSLVRGQNGAMAMVRLAGQLFVQGLPVNFSEINQRTGSTSPALITDFTPYPWSSHTYWYESRASKQHRLKPFPRHDLLGRLDNYTDAELTWRNVVSLDDIPWLKDHRMQSLTTFPLTAYLGMAIEAGCQKAQLHRHLEPSQIDGYHLREVQASKAMIMDSGIQYETAVVLRPYAEGTRQLSNAWDEFVISSYAPKRGWLEHCRGLIHVKKVRDGNPVNSSQFVAAAARRASVEVQDGTSIPSEAFYGELDSLGAQYTGPFKSTWESIHLGAALDRAVGTIGVPETASLMPMEHETPSIVPAAALDVILQAIFPLLGAGSGTMPSLFMPSAIGDMHVSTRFPNQAGQSVQAVATGALNFDCPGPSIFTIDAWHPSSQEPVLSMTEFRLSPVGNEGDATQMPRRLCYKVEWETFCPDSAATPSSVQELTVGTTPTTIDSAIFLNDVKRDSAKGTAEPLVVPNGVPRVDEACEIADSSPTMNGFDAAHNAADLASAHDAGLGINGKQNEALSVLTTKTLNDLEQMHYQSALVEAVADGSIVLVADCLTPAVSSLVDVIQSVTGKPPAVSRLANVTATYSTHCICLDELESDVLADMSAPAFAHLQQVLLSAASVLWVTCGAYRSATHPKRNLAQGLFRTVRSETGRNVSTLDVDSQPSDKADVILRAFAAMSQFTDDSPADCEFTECNGVLTVPRVVPDEDTDLDVFQRTGQSAPYPQAFGNRRLKLAVGTPGALDSLYWKDEPESSLRDDEVEIKVACTGMNFKDVVITMGQLTSPYVGVECSGTVTRLGQSVTGLKPGDRVCAMSEGAYSTYARCKATSAALIPDDMTFAVAASIPVVYCTAYYGIVDLGRLEPTDKILIHAASGGVGQAAIQLSQMIGADIYATVGTLEKKQFLVDTYGIPESRIFYSRDGTFGQAIRDASGGVDVVLNSLAGDLLRETWACLAPFGRFIEIGKKDITCNTRLEMAKFEANCTFSSVDLTLVAAHRPRLMSRILQNVMNLLKRKIIHPIGPITSTSIEDVEAALRKLQSGKTRGKIVVHHEPSAKVKATHPVTQGDLLRHDATYLIIGGTGGIGTSIARRFLAYGARHIVLLSRSGSITASVQNLLDEASVVGAEIRVNKCDVASKTAVTALATDLQALPPVRGIIHAAMVLRDMLFEKLMFDDWRAVVECKVAGAQNFHDAYRDLDFYVMLSSVSSIIGNRGQAAYAAANSFLDALARHRRANGLAATALNLAAVDDVGYLTSDAANLSQVLQNVSNNTISEAEVLALVERAISSDLGQCITGIDVKSPAGLPFYASDARFTHLRDEALAQKDELPVSADTPVAELLSHAATTDDAIALVASKVGAKLGAILMLPPEDIAAQQGVMSITAFGLDSLNAIELRNWIGKELQAHLQVLELLTSGRLEDLAVLVLKKTRLVGPWTEQAEPPAAT